MKTGFRRYLPLCLMAALALAAGLFVLTRGNLTVEELLLWSPENKWLAAAVAVLAYAVKSQTVFLPYGAVAAAVGLAFDLPAALLVNLAGSAVCVTLPYLSGRATDGALLERASQKSARIRALYEENRDSLFFVSLALRAMNLPYDLLGVFFGSIRAPYPAYLASSLLGLLPAMLLYTALGRDLDLFSAPVLVCAGVDVLCIAAAWLALRARRKKRRENPHEEA